MTNLTNLLPSASYGDVLTTTNGGQGLTTTLQTVQDGLGNNSPLQMSQTAVQFNNILSIPVWTTPTRPDAPLLGSIGFNITLGDIEIWKGGGWYLPGRTSPQIAKGWGYVQPDGTLLANNAILDVILTGATYTVVFENSLDSDNYCVVSAVSFTPGVGKVRQFTVTAQSADGFSFEIIDVTGVTQTDTYSYFSVFASGYA